MIEIRGLTLTYGEKTIFENLSLSIKKGEKILLNAPSGRGKSSLIKVIMGFQKKDSGEILLDGEIIDGKNISKLRGRTVWVNQDVNLRKVSVATLIEDIFKFEKNKKVNYKKKLYSLLGDFDLSREILGKNVEKLSGGERQRLGLIIAILLDREIMCLDEVTSSLDIAMKKRVEEYIMKSNKTVLLISHDTHWDMSRFREVKW